MPPLDPGTPNSTKLRALAAEWRRRGNAAKALQLERLAAEAFAAETGTEPLRDGTVRTDASRVAARPVGVLPQPSVAPLPETPSQQAERERALGEERLGGMVREADATPGPADPTLGAPSPLAGDVASFLLGIDVRPPAPAAPARPFSPSTDTMGAVVDRIGAAADARAAQVGQPAAPDAAGQRGGLGMPQQGTYDPARGIATPVGTVDRVEDPRRGQLSANANAEFQLRQKAAYARMTGDPLADTYQQQADALREQTLLIRRGDPQMGVVGRVGASAMDAALRTYGVSQHPEAARREGEILGAGQQVPRAVTEDYPSGGEPAVTLGQENGLPETVGGLLGTGAALTAGPEGGLLGAEGKVGSSIVERLAARKATAGLAADLAEVGASRKLLPSMIREGAGFAIPSAAGEASVAAQEGRDPLDAALTAGAQNAGMGAAFGALGPVLHGIKETGIAQSIAERLAERRAAQAAKAAAGARVEATRARAAVAPLAELAQRERDVAVAHDPALTPDARPAPVPAAEEVRAQLAERQQQTIKETLRRRAAEARAQRPVPDEAAPPAGETFTADEAARVRQLTGVDVRPPGPPETLRERRAAAEGKRIVDRRALEAAAVDERLSPELRAEAARRARLLAGDTEAAQGPQLPLPEEPEAASAEPAGELAGEPSEQAPAGTIAEALRRRAPAALDLAKRYGPAAGLIGAASQTDDEKTRDALALGGVMLGTRGAGGEDSFRFDHYSPQRGLTRLDPRYMDTGRPGAERARADRPQAIHVYRAGARPEYQFRNDARYTGEVPKAALYDLATDKDGIVARWRKTAPGDHSALERSIAKKYAGYYHSGSDNPDVVKLFRPVNVTEAGTGAPKGVKPYGVRAVVPPLALLAGASQTDDKDKRGLLAMGALALGTHSVAGGEAGGHPFDRAIEVAQQIPKTTSRSVKGWMEQFAPHIEGRRAQRAFRDGLQARADMEDTNGLVSADGVFHAIQHAQRVVSAPERFYSRLERHLQKLDFANSKPKPAADWIGKLKGGGDFSKAEFENTLLPALEQAKAEKRQLTKADVLDLFDQNRIQVSEHRLQSAESDDEQTPQEIRNNLQWDQRAVEDNQREVEMRREQAAMAADPARWVDDPDTGLAKAIEGIGELFTPEERQHVATYLRPMLVEELGKIRDAQAANPEGDAYDAKEAAIQRLHQAVKPLMPEKPAQTAAGMKAAGWKVEVDRPESDGSPYGYYRVTKPDGTVMPGQYWDNLWRDNVEVGHYLHRSTIEQNILREASDNLMRPWRRLGNRLTALVDNYADIHEAVRTAELRLAESRERVAQGQHALAAAEAREAARAAATDRVPGERHVGDDKYRTYQRVPGLGTNYRELLMSLDDFGAKPAGSEYTGGHFSGEVPDDAGHVRVEDVQVQPQLPASPEFVAAHEKLRALNVELGEAAREYEAHRNAGRDDEAAALFRRAQELHRKVEVQQDVVDNLPEPGDDLSKPAGKGLNVLEAQSDWVQQANKGDTPRGFQRRRPARPPEEQARLDAAVAATREAHAARFAEHEALLDSYDEASARVRTAGKTFRQEAYRHLAELDNARGAVAHSGSAEEYRAADEAYHKMRRALEHYPTYGQPNDLLRLFHSADGAAAFPEVQGLRAVPGFEKLDAELTPFAEMRAQKQDAAARVAAAETAMHDAAAAASTVENPNGLPPTPFAETKDALGLVFGKALHEAAGERGNYDHLLWSDSENRQSRASLAKEPADLTYDQLLPSIARKTLERLGFKGVKIERIRLKGYGHWKIDLTPEMKAAIRKAGVPLLALAGVAALPNDADAQDPNAPAGDGGDSRLRAFLATTAGAAALAAILRMRGGDGGFRAFLAGHPQLDALVDRAESLTRRSDLSRRLGSARPERLPREGVGTPIEPAPPVDAGRDPRMVNRAKFDLDPAGQQELDRAVTKLVAEGKATKKRVTWEETKQVASDLGLDPDAIIRREGRLSGAELLAMRDLVSHNADVMTDLAKEVQDPRTSDARRGELRAQMARLATRNEQFLARFIKERSQTGRDLNALKILARRHLDPASWLEHARRLKGIELSQEEIDTVHRLAREKNRAGLVRYVSGLRVSSPIDKFLTWWKAGLLTSPTTHFANIAGNAAMMGMETAKDVPASAADAIIGAIRSGWETGSLRGSGRRFRGKAASVEGATVDQFRGLGRGFEAARQVFRTGISPDDAEKWDVRHTTYKNKFLQAYTDLVFNSLSAEDQVFRSAALGRALAEHARLSLDQQGLRRGTPEYGTQLAELLKNPTPAIAAKAIEDAAFATFNNDNPAARWMGAHRREFRDAPVGRTLIGMTIPFVKTPTNVALRTLDYTPAGLFIGAYKGFRAGGLEGQRLFADNLGRSLTGSMFMMLGYQMAKEGRATGASPSAPADRATWEARGVLPNAVLTHDGSWVQLGRITPAGLLIALGAQMHQLEGGAASPADFAGKSAGAFGRTMIDQTFLKGVSSLIDAASEPDRRGGAWLETQLGGLVPFSGISGRIARGLDDRERAVDSPLDAIAAKVPGWRATLPARVDATGQPVPIPGGSTAGRLARAVADPFATRPDRTTPAEAEMERLDVPFGLPSREVADATQPKGKRQRTEPERRAWLASEGPEAARAMDRVTTLPEYQAVPDRLKRQILDRVRSRVTAEANARIDEHRDAKTPADQLVQSAVESVALDVQNERDRAAVKGVLTALRTGGPLPAGTDLGTMKRAVGTMRSDAVNTVLRPTAESLVADAERAADPEGELAKLAMAPGLIGSLAKRRLAVLRMVKDTSAPPHR